MKKRLLLVLAVIAIVAVAGVVAGGAFRFLRDREEPWTTRSRAALEEFEKGLDDMGRYYWFDAHAHLQRALELDPEFVAPQIFLTYVYEKDEERDQALDRLRQADLAPLSPQERFLARYRLLLFERQRDKAKALLDAFLEEYPDNGWALRERCDQVWDAQDWPAAETCFQRLIELYPNKVQAQNRLGYIAMAMGRFSEAEERFRTYLYIAPDQANPHDSLGELLTVVGRYDEAEH